MTGEGPETTRTSEVLGAAGVAVLFDKTIRTIDRWLATTDFPRPRQIGGSRYWLRDELIAWVAKQPTWAKRGAGGVHHRSNGGRR